MTREMQLSAQDEGVHYAGDVAQPLSGKTLARGLQSGLHRARQQVISSAAAWQKLWAEYSSGLPKSATDVHAPAIDWTRQAAIIIALGDRKDRSAIQIMAVEARRDAVVVRYKISAPKTKKADGKTDDKAAAKVLVSQPHHIIVIPKPSHPVRFVEIKE
jgi:hypothetical protein